MYIYIYVYDIYIYIFRYVYIYIYICNPISWGVSVQKSTPSTAHPKGMVSSSGCSAGLSSQPNGKSKKKTKFRV